MMNPQAIRNHLRVLRQSLSPAVLQKTEILVTEYILSQSWFLEAEKIGFYWAMGAEVSLQLLMEKALEIGKTCYLPVCLEAEQSLSFVSYKKGDILLPNRYRIPEPSLTENKIVSPQDLDLVFVPLLAFDASGNRLGSGKGYYDRTFAFLPPHPRVKPQLIGLAYQFQQIKHLDVNPWDVGMDKIIVFDVESSKVSTVSPS